MVIIRISVETDEIRRELHGGRSAFVVELLCRQPLHIDDRSAALQRAKDSQYKTRKFV